MENLDGRDTRWQAHREARRAELVDSTLRAIRRHGPQVTVEEIAALAGTSKTVLYRYFHDRNGLYEAVVDRVVHNVFTGLQGPMGRSDHAGIEDLVARIADSYVRLVERDPEIYTFVRNRPAAVFGEEDPIVGVTSRIAEGLARPLADVMERSGREPAAAPVVAHGIVGFVRSAVDYWVAEGRTLSPAELVAQIGDVFGRTFAELPA